jgi:hypothetical protein
VIPTLLTKVILILVMGTHGHTGFKDLLWNDVDKLRHKISIPLLIVKKLSRATSRYSLYLCSENLGKRMPLLSGLKKKE